MHADVGTDRSRLDVVSDGFIDAFNGSPLAAEGALVKSRGYAATPLTGVWANFPYLHNGSVPTLTTCSVPASERPAIFEVMAARTLDRDARRSAALPEPARRSARRGELLRRFGDDRNWFNTRAAGQRERRSRRLVRASGRTRTGAR